MRPKSTWHSSPGSPSATRTVVPGPGRRRTPPARSGAASARARPPPGGPAGLHLHHRQPSASSQALIWSWLATSSRHASPWPSLRCGRTASTTEPMNSSLELALPAVATRPSLDRRLHVAAHGLAVHPGQPLDGPLALAPQPQPQDLTYLEHTNLPEAHRRPLDPLTDGGESTGSEPALVDPRVVPLLAGRRPHQWPNRRSHNWPKGGPMLLAKPAPRRSHAPGRRHQARRSLTQRFGPSDQPLIAQLAQVRVVQIVGQGHRPRTRHHSPLLSPPNRRITCRRDQHGQHPPP